MKKILLIVLFSGAFSAFAEDNSKTVSQRTADQMTAALQSEELQTLLKENDGSGNLKRVEYFQPSRMNPSQSRIEIKFLSHGGPSLQECLVNVFVNTNTNTVEGLTQMPCKVSK